MWDNAISFIYKPNYPLYMSKENQCCIYCVEESTANTGVEYLCNPPPSWELEFSRIAKIETNTLTEAGTEICDLDIKFDQIKDFIRSLLASKEKEIVEAIHAREIAVVTKGVDWNEEGRREGNWELGYDDGAIDAVSIVHDIMSSKK